jgi:hypothetical protein
MDKHTEQFDRLAKRIFGENARAETSTGTLLAPGAVTILVGDKCIGEAETFEGALQAAMRAMGTGRERGCLITTS